MQQRYYDPVAGRFLSVDPIVTDANTGAGFGLYTYVDHNPYAKIDPDGREPVECPNNRCPTSTTYGSSANKIDPVDWNSVAKRSIDIAASIAWGLAPGSGAVDCWRHGCSGWEYGLAAIDLMPGAGKVLAASFKVAVVFKATRAAKGIREIPWSNKTVRDAAKALESGATEVRVGSRSQAEELFLGRYQGDGYRNVTGMSPRESKEMFGGKDGSYHWDIGEKAYPHGANHLQVHTHEGPIVRIYFP